MKKPFRIWGAAIVLFYAIGVWSGYEMGAPKRGFIPANIRQSPGGYRSYYFWRGGK